MTAPVWTDPTTHVWAVGEVLTAANMNTYVQQDIAFAATAWAARMKINAAQTITQGSSANFNAQTDWDPMSMISSSGGTSCIFTIPSGMPSNSRWNIGWSITCTNPGATGSNDFRVEIYKNPSGSNTLISDSSMGGVANPGNMTLNRVDAATFAPSDVVQLKLHNNDGAHGSVVTINDGTFCYFWIALIGVG